MCTAAMIESLQKNPYWARTMDFPIDFFESGGEVLYMPKDNPLDMLSGTITAKYDFFGMGLPNSYMMMDGINEVGLTGGLFFFEEATWANETSLKKKDKLPVVLDELVSYFLAQCQTVEEVGALASRLAVIEKSTMPENGLTPLHLMFADVHGHAIVLEPVENGEFTIHYQTTKTMTNSPTYDWHVTNLRNYVNLSDYTIAQSQVGELVIKDIESGSGLLGLPGDYTSPSRFIKITMLTKMMDKVNDEHALNALYTAFHSVIIPKGIEKDTPTVGDSTSYWVGYDIKNRTLRLLPIASQTFTTVSLAELSAQFGDNTTHLPINLTENLYHHLVGE
ncbi:linear amide C-N hydrolase [Enterococcus bulliens]